MIGAARDAVIVTAFVLVMMLVIEYIHTATRGLWQQRFVGSPWKQYVLAAFLGSIPGCLGGFADVALFIHGRISFGALVAGMLAAAGDESFVMFALIPRQAAYFHLALFGLGVGAGLLVDLVVSKTRLCRYGICTGLQVHVAAESGAPFPERVVGGWHLWSPARVPLTAGLAILLAGVLTRNLAPDVPQWGRILIVSSVLVTVWIVATASDHFLQEHLWRHVVVRHLPQVFLWTLGTLVLLNVFVPAMDMGAVLREGRWLVLVIACAVGLIPESGPNLVFVMLYAKGMLPVSILLANSIVQDGHSALPLLSHSRRAFLAMKIANAVIGLVVGSLMLAAGY